MKSAGVCPKCSSKQIIKIPSEFGTYNMIKIDLLKFANLTRYICADCGYIEQYISDDSSLSKLRQKK
jgi:predicted nucleic-acid-binding Zn-ribbon protein